MKNLIKGTFFIFIFIFIFIFSSSYITDTNDIYNELPVGSKLTFGFLRKTESIIKVKDYNVLLYDLENDGRNVLFFPHLVFFDKSMNHISSSYFASSWISDIMGDTIFANTTERLKDKSNAFRNDVPERLNIQYHKYKNKNGPLQGGGSTDTTLLRVEYNNQTNLVSLIFEDKDKSIKHQNISLNNIKYNYQNKEIMIRDSDNGVRIEIKYFHISNESLDNFLLSVLGISQLPLE